MGVDQDYKNLMKQGTRAALADGWGGSMLATDLQDVLFGTPYPLQAEANLGVMKEDHVNIIVHGHEPILSEMIVAMCQKPEIIEYAKSKGAKGIQLGGICCTANELFQRHGVPQAGTYLQQEWPSSPAPAMPWWWTSSVFSRMWPTWPSAFTPS
jgi:carbon-monoxide dehydrogenase catalytic subunit